MGAIPVFEYLAIRAAIMLAVFIAGCVVGWWVRGWRAPERGDTR